MYRIELSDGPRVCHGTTIISKFRTRKAAALLAYLALHPGSHSRDRLLELFWPEQELDAARHSLSMALGHLRGPLEKELGQPEGALICATRDTVSLNQSAYTTDLDTLPAGFNPERVLPGFYDDWLLELRERLAQTLPPTIQIEPLPAAISPYLGREDLRAEVLTLLEGTRLLTLVGPGGVGKTRLALETLQSRTEQGSTVVWVELSPLSDPRGITDRIVAALGLTHVGELIPTLRRTPLLLGLDNCEHLIAAAAKEAERLLRACPPLTILATSREPLRITGETVLRLPGLTEAESAALFTERAGRAQPGWEVTREERPLLSRLCLRLDGLPLALELAAAKLRTHSLAELVQRLELRLAVLTSGNRVAEPRQQTLRATIAWSYDLLSEPERQLLMCLSVFQGGWTGEHAGELWGDPDAILEQLDALVDKSLIQVEHTPRGMRYRFLDTIREFAAGKLAKQPTEAVQALRRRHLDLFFALARSGADTYDAQRLAWARRLDPEQDNIRQALAFCRDDQPERSLEFCSALGTYWQLRIRLREQRQECEAALGCTAKSLPFSAARVETLHHLAYACKGLGDWAAARAALSLLTGKELTARRQAVLGLLAMNMGDLDESLLLFQQALAQARSEEIPLDIRFVLLNMAQVQIARGDLVSARAAIEEGDAWKPLTTDTSRANQDQNDILLDVLEGKRQGVRERLRSTFQVYQRLEIDMVCYLVLCGLFAFREGDCRRSAQLFGASFGWCESHGHILEQPERGLREKGMERLRVELGESAFDTAFAEGRAWSTEQIYAELQTI